MAAATSNRGDVCVATPAVVTDTVAGHGCCCDGDANDALGGRTGLTETRSLPSRWDATTERNAVTADTAAQGIRTS